MILHRNSLLAIAVCFEPRDLWLGVFWRRYEEWGRHGLEVFICILPMLPLHIDIRLSRR